jgi:hypothetical protein
MKLKVLNNKMLRIFSSIDGRFVENIRVMVDRVSRLQDEQPWEIS